MTKYDILFINPPSSNRYLKKETIVDEFFLTLKKLNLNMLGDSNIEPNYGLLSIAAALRHDFPNLKIKILDLNIMDINKRKRYGKGLEIDEVSNIIKNCSSVIGGISFMTPNYGQWAKDLIPLLSKQCNHLYLGGIHPTVRYKEVFKTFPFIKGIVVGEAEAVFCEIIKEHFNKNQISQDYKNFIYDKDKFDVDLAISNRRLPENAKKNICKARLNNDQLNMLPNLAYDLQFDEDELIIPRIYLSRGCNKKCTMCSVGDFYKNGRISQQIPISIEPIISKIKELYVNYSRIKHFVIGDLTFTDSKATVKNFLLELKKLNDEFQNEKKEWWCQTRGDLLDEDIVRLMKEANITEVAVGCEAATNKQLSHINKDEDVERIKKGLRILKDNNIKIQTYWIIGLPFETKEYVKKTQEAIVQYIKEGLTTVPHISILVPYPNTELHKYDGNNGIKLNQNAKKAYELYWMNCDEYGYGEPVYSTIDANENVLLNSREIYELWLETLQIATNALKEQYENLN